MVDALTAPPSVSIHAPAQMRVRAAVLTAPGINCDRETMEACRAAGAEVEALHLNQLLERRRSLLDFSFLVLPGGFSYGDHLGAGTMLATALRHGFMADLLRFIGDGRPVLGICNGFQVLSRLGLLGPIALIPNTSGRFVCRWVPVTAAPSACIFLHGLEGLDLELPIAHGEGRVVVQDAALDDVLQRAPLRYRGDPNGSTARIAGVCNAAGNVFGLMPHPERYLTPLHHPDARRKGTLPPLGLQMFRNAVAHVRTGV